MRGVWLPVIAAAALFGFVAAALLLGGGMSAPVPGVADADPATRAETVALQALRDRQRDPAAVLFREVRTWRFGPEDERAVCGVIEARDLPGGSAPFIARVVLPASADRGPEAVRGWRPQPSSAAMVILEDGPGIGRPAPEARRRFCHDVNAPRRDDNALFTTPPLTPEQALGETWPTIPLPSSSADDPWAALIEPLPWQTAPQSVLPWTGSPPGPLQWPGAPSAPGQTPGAAAPDSPGWGGGTTPPGAVPPPLTFGTQTGTAGAAGGGGRWQSTTREGWAIVASPANLRAGPEGGEPVLAVVPRGTVLGIFGRASGGWVQVGDGEPWGWVHGSLLDEAGAPQANR